ncbi:homoserine kinase [Leptolyngbya sp. FACHB-36]|uniref:homoserine kinase n=1 Tax=Leptolyngbya sp. FACHB-36 TaxID=2692808 RepID=UPI001681B898|nr:homoserine kinase [Leptolyngbya sp. FACHB-36]MBD2021285.1 homoserine kinase [Leptolyngbya sp. FACHB-36]
MSASTVAVIVPATTANIGPGFDCVGAALTLYNQFEFSLLAAAHPLEITVSGVGAERVKPDASNLVYQAFVKLYQHLDRSPPPVHIAINMNVPLARGLGSSATAIVGGLVGANHLAGLPLTQAEVMQLAIAIEGHPDNVVPALIGGCQLAASGSDRPWEICDLEWDAAIVPVVAIPDFELSTAEARRVLPDQYSRTDAIFNTAHLGLLIRALATGNADWLRSALDDRIHQPYRQALIPGYEAVREAAIGAGAYGMVISGAGPTLLALANSDTVGAVEVALADAWVAQGVSVEVKGLQVDRQGAISEFKSV